MLIWRVLGYCSKHKMWRQFEIIRIANKIMIQQKMDQIITHKPKGSVDISVYLAWTNISGFMISSQEHWLPGGGGKGLCDPSSPVSCSSSLATAGTRAIHLVSDERQRVFLFMFSMVFLPL